MLQLTMELYPFGKFVISGGVVMAIMTAIVSFAIDSIEAVVGESVSPYLLIIVIGMSVIAVGFFNDKYKSTVTVPIGVCGWIVTLILLFIHYSSQ